MLRFNGFLEQSIAKFHLTYFRLKIVVAETYGEEEESIFQTTKLFWRHNVSAIIGPVETCNHEVRCYLKQNIVFKPHN